MVGADVDPMRDEAAPDASAAVAAPTERAQAVRCGERWFAFPYGWARSAVEQVDLSAVPGAPVWLAGAANVEGRIVPAIDLLAWRQPGQFVDARSKDTRLLVGGEGAATVAVLFEGLPRVIRIVRDAAMVADGDRLGPYVVGHDVDDSRTFVLDGQRWVDALTEELTLR
jgi:chemotaxis signal transduction protein